MTPPSSPYTEEYFMRQALLEATLAYEAGEVPIGAVVEGKSSLALTTRSSD